MIISVNNEQSLSNLIFKWFGGMGKCTVPILAEKTADNFWPIFDADRTLHYFELPWTCTIITFDIIIITRKWHTNHATWAITIQIVIIFSKRCIVVVLVLFLDQSLVVLHAKCNQLHDRLISRNTHTWIQRRSSYAYEMHLLMHRMNQLNIQNAYAQLDQAFSNL